MNKVIAYIVSNPGSNDARVFKMVNAAASRGYKVHLFGTLKPGFLPYENNGNITIHRLEWNPVKRLIQTNIIFKNLNFINKKLCRFTAKTIFPYIKYFLFSSIFADQISKVNPDIVHAHDLICLPTARQVSKINKIPYIYDAHEYEIHRNPPLPILQKLYVFFIESLYSLNASYVITIGRYYAAGIAKHISSKKIKILYNSPVINKTSYNLRNDLKITDNKKIVLFVGKLTMNRGIEEVVKILPSLPSNVVFATVGPCDDTQRKIFTNLAEKFNVSSRFTILPPVPYDNVVDYIKEADLGIVSLLPIVKSYQYCMPNKLFELSFANVPVLSNDLDEIREFLSEHGNGTAINIEDPVLLNYYISKLIKSKKEFKMSDKTYEKLKQNYSWDKQLEKLFFIYSDTLKKTRC